MPYTVKKLAKLSGVSVRTLHYYDEIGLLKPAYYSESGYRCYEEEQLLMLQQILFFRELDIPLKEIRKIVKKSDFDKVGTLNTHKKTLLKNLDRTTKLIKTIDKTIMHLYPRKFKSWHLGGAKAPGLKDRMSVNIELRLTDIRSFNRGSFRSSRNGNF
jgi:DNA-binding transcriptional MerR regulator